MNRRREGKGSRLGKGLLLGVVLLSVLTAVFYFLSKWETEETQTKVPVFIDSGRDEAHYFRELFVLKTLETARRLAQGYFYEEAVQAIEAFEGSEEDARLKQEKERIRKEQNALAVYDGPISHVFFHSLIVDTGKAFDGDSMSNGYNYWMTTVSEFQAMLEELYKRGYVLVRIQDVAGPVREKGKTSYRRKEILLPKGKKPLVLSEDDVAYYEYMKEDGFARRMVIDSDGKIACQMEKDKKLVTARDFDVVPLLDRFVEEHPDFSYRGAKGILALTGYEGALGYRVNNPDSETLQEDKEALKKLAAALREDGWEFASHGYGHLHTQKITLEKLKSDTDRWIREIGSLVGATDIYIYPYGEEIDYQGGKLAYLLKKGFRYFCGVYAYPYIEVTPGYVRMTRRNLDGFTMHFYPDRVTDLFDLEKVYDPSRPEFK